MNKFFGAATLTAGLMAMSGPALADHDWQGDNRSWTPHSTCSLTLNRAYQANPGQPIHLVITNNSSTRVRYDVEVILRRGRNQVFSGTVSVDNANRNERSTAGTSNGYSGDLSESRLSVRVISCSVRS